MSKQAQGQEPKLITENGRLIWRFPTGVSVPFIGGGDGTGGDGASGAGGNTGGKSQEGDPNDPNKDGQDPPDGKFSKEYVEKLRKEAAEHRVNAKKLQEELQKIKDSQLSETERLQKRVGELEASEKARAIAIQEKVTKYSVMLAAQKLGIVDPEAAYKLLDTSDIEYDDEGEPRNIEKLLRAMLEKRPYLSGGTGGSGNPTNPGGNRSNGSKLTMADVRKMTPDQINARWAEVQEALKNNQ